MPAASKASPDGDPLTADKVSTAHRSALLSRFLLLASCPHLCAHLSSASHLFRVLVPFLALLVRTFCLYLFCVPLSRISSLSSYLLLAFMSSHFLRRRVHLTTHLTPFKDTKDFVAPTQTEKSTMATRLSPKTSAHSISTPPTTGGLHLPASVAILSDMKEGLSLCASVEKSLRNGHKLTPEDHKLIAAAAGINLGKPPKESAQEDKPVAKSTEDPLQTMPPTLSVSKLPGDEKERPPNAVGNTACSPKQKQPDQRQVKLSPQAQAAGTPRPKGKQRLVEPQKAEPSSHTQTTGTMRPKGKHRMEMYKEIPIAAQVVDTGVHPHLRRGMRQEPVAKASEAAVAGPSAWIDSNHPLAAAAAKVDPKHPVRPKGMNKREWNELRWHMGWVEAPAQKIEYRGNSKWPKIPKISKVVEEYYEDDDDEEDEPEIDPRDNDSQYDIRNAFIWNDWGAPPPWQDRDPFADKNLEATVNKWRHRHPASCTENLTYLVRLPEFKGAKCDGEVRIHGKVVADRYENCEIVPRTWIPDEIDGDAPQQFWRSFLSRAPEPLDERDMADYPQFWENKNIFFHLGLAPRAVLNQSYHPPGHWKRAKLTIQDRLDDLKKGKKWKRLQDPGEVVLLDQSTLGRRGDTRSGFGFTPKVALYLRPAKASDAPEIMRIYNEYIQNTISAYEFKPRELKHIVDRMNTVISGGLPYIVAVKGNGVAAGIRRQNHAFEEILGFAAIDDYCNQGSMYRFTYEMELFVDRGHLNMGVGSCLLDRLLHLVDPGYMSHSQAPWITFSDDYIQDSINRSVKTITAPMPHYQDTLPEGMVLFMRKFGFKKVGMIPEMGHKKGHV